jgi:cytochrome c556
MGCVPWNHSRMGPNRSFTTFAWSATRLAAAIGALLIAATIAGEVVSAQERGGTSPQDAILARKALMDAMEDRFNPMERAAQEGTVDLDAARQDADAIAVMLTAFPHLFPPASKPAASDDPVKETLASAEVWTDFADFYRRAGDASRLAHRLAHSGSLDELRDTAMELRVACDSCHALYMESP